MRIHGLACAILCAASLLTGCTSETGPAATAQLTNPTLQHAMGEGLGGRADFGGGARGGEEGGPSHLGAADPRNGQ